MQLAREHCSPPAPAQAADTVLGTYENHAGHVTVSFASASRSTPGLALEAAGTVSQKSSAFAVSFLSHPGCVTASPRSSVTWPGSPGVSEICTASFPAQDSFAGLKNRGCTCPSSCTCTCPWIKQLIANKLDVLRF